VIIMDLDTIQNKMQTSLNNLKQHDNQLLEINVNERTISHKLAEYLQCEIPNLSVDCEYNRYERLPKTLDIPKDPISWEDIDSKSVFPDIVIHKRKTNDYNLLVIEIKKSSNKNGHDFDKTKIRAFTRPPYNYNFGLFLEINVEGGDDIQCWCENGEFI